MGSAGPPLAVHCLYGGRHRQLRRHGIVEPSRLGGLFAIASSLPAVVHRPVHVRAAVCHEVVQRATDRRIGVNTMVNKTTKKTDSKKDKSPAQLIDARIQEGRLTN